MFFIGIDPGVSGAIALYDPKTQKVEVRDMPVATMRVSGKNRNRVMEPVFADILRGWYLTRDVFALVEQVNSMPKQGVASTFTFGMSFGICTGVLAGVGIPFDTMRPQEWKKLVRVGQGKDASRALAAKLFPSQADLFARKKDDGRADACLLAMAANKITEHDKK